MDNPLEHDDSSLELFLKNYSIHDFDVPLTTVDIVIFGVCNEQLQVLLIKRGEHPEKGKWALPGGFIVLNQDQDLEAAAMRKLQQKTGVEAPYLEQLQTFGNSTRDVRGWSVTVVYFALISIATIVLKQGHGSIEAQWMPVTGNCVDHTLAFDHSAILAIAVERLRNKVEYTSLPIHLLPTEFTLTDLQRIYEIVLQRNVEKSAFRKRIREADMIESVPGKMRHASNRPAQIYRLKQNAKTYFYRRTM